MNIRKSLLIFGILLMVLSCRTTINESETINNSPITANTKNLNSIDNAQINLNAEYNANEKFGQKSNSNMVKSSIDLPENVSGDASKLPGLHNSSTVPVVSAEEKYRLYYAATATGDKITIEIVLRKTGLINDAGHPASAYQDFFKGYITWMAKNKDFIQSLSTKEKAQNYLKANL